MIKLHMTQGDGIGWAIDEDARLMRQALEGLVRFVPGDEADTILSTWFVRLTGGPGQKPMPGELLSGRRILCWSPNRPFHDASLPGFGEAGKLVGRWLVGSRQAKAEMGQLGLAASRIPYLVDTSIFQPLPAQDPSLAELRATWGIPADRYLIGNFFRDTEGGAMSRPKLQKGPDVFLEIVRQLEKRGVPVHILLAGPRRGWLCDRLAELKASVTFVGQQTRAGEDDLALNTLPRAKLNQLYNLLDLCLIPSRWEGGPHAILEATAAGKRVLSTRVGIAEDVLEPASLFDHPDEAAAIIERDISGGVLLPTLAPQQERLRTSHVPLAARALWEEVLAELPVIPAYPILERPSTSSLPLVTRLRSAVRRRLKPALPSISLWHEFVKPPYGGGNQFMMALRGELARRGVKVMANAPRADVHIVNSVHFDVAAFRRRCARRGKAKVIHRIDGPIQLYRGTSQELDELCFELNAEFAYATVIQSSWTFARIIELGYQPVKPVIVRNTVDPAIFHAKDRQPPGARKIRLISTSWSGNPRKGGDVYKWLDENLDWSRFDYTFLGNLSEQLTHIHRLPPAPSETVAQLLRSHDIYITASRNDPCSNALIEALACGLPALYLNSGGHPEIVGLGGLGFDEPGEIPALLERIVDHYESFQRLIATPRLSDVADIYLQLAIEAA
jgi:glycosyltransferase involved in cell wall biosynthesis